MDGKLLQYTHHVHIVYRNMFVVTQEIIVFNDWFPGVLLLSFACGSSRTTRNTPRNCLYMFAFLCVHTGCILTPSDQADQSVFSSDPTLFNNILFLWSVLRLV